MDQVLLGNDLEGCFIGLNILESQEVFLVETDNQETDT